MSKIPTGKCPMCGYRKRVNQDGKVYHHNIPGTAEVPCVGGGDEPVEGTIRYPEPSAELAVAEVAPMPWFQRYYYHLVLAAGMAAAFGLGWGVGTGVAGGWRW